MHEFLSAWKSFGTNVPPFVFPGDQRILECDGLCCRHAGWNGFVADPEFGAPGNSQLYLDLLPMPFVGNLSSASVFLLMLNPGFGPHDFFGEYEVPDYRAALIANLRQARSKGFLFLDPRFSWHGGFRYWHRKLREVITTFATRTGLSYGPARQFVQAQIAAIELVPYHSVNFSIPKRVLNSLRSVELVRSFVHDELLPHAKLGARLLVVTRGVKYWRLPHRHPNVVEYGQTEARSAHLSARSSGGNAILEFLIAAHQLNASANRN